MTQQNTDMLDGLQAAVITDAQKKVNKSKYEFDSLKMYFGEDYEVAGIKISEPTIGDILRIGENNFYQSLSPILYNSTSIRVPLWDMGIKNWCIVKDIEVFSFLSSVPNFNTEPAKLLFKDINIFDFKLYEIKKSSDGESECFLRNDDLNMILYEDDYMQIAEYIRTMLNIHPKVEKAKGKTARKWMVDEDRLNALQKPKNNNNSTLLSLISACVNHPGFKYKLQELRNVGICEFMDSVKRLQIYEATNAILHGRYCGFADLSKVPDDQFNFMREI